MRLPIQYALTYPDRIVSSFERVDFSRYSNLTFEKPDPVTFRNLGLAFEAMEKGGNIPCILNAANEIAVDAFLKEKVSFTRMPEIIEETISRVCFIQKPDLQDYIETDREGRKIAVDIIEK